MQPPKNRFQILILHPKNIYLKKNVPFLMPIKSKKKNNDFFRHLIIIITIY